jgi:hypothetical protein
MTPISPHDAIVTAEYEVHHQLIFRACLSLARWRLALAALFIALLLAGLIFFFMLIGEQKILWQTSPLFIGIPLLGIGGQILRLHATARKYVSSLLPSQRVVRYAFRADAGAYEVLFGESYGLISWSDHLKAMEKPDFFLLFLNARDITVIPKSAFEPLGIPGFRNILKSKLGDRAHVRNS